MREGIQKILEETRRGLNPPTKEDCDRVMSRWMFGAYSEKMMKFAPWSFALVKLLWKKGEEPWEE